MGAIKDKWYYTKQDLDKFVDLIDAQVGALEKRIKELEDDVKKLESK